MVRWGVAFDDAHKAGEGITARNVLDYGGRVHVVMSRLVSHQRAQTVSHPLWESHRSDRLPKGTKYPHAPEQAKASDMMQCGKGGWSKVWCGRVVIKIT